MFAYYSPTGSGAPLQFNFEQRGNMARQKALALQWRAWRRRVSTFVHGRAIDAGKIREYYSDSFSGGTSFLRGTSRQMPPRMTS